jgi:hypothetical protein
VLSAALRRTTQAEDTPLEDLGARDAKRRAKGGGAAPAPPALADIGDVMKQALEQHTKSKQARAAEQARCARVLHADA